MKKTRMVLLFVTAVIAVAAVGYFSAVKVGAYINNQKSAERKKAKEERKEAFTQQVLKDMGTIAVGDTLPDHLFEDLYHQPVRLSEIVGKKNILSFFTPQCDHCNDEMDAVKQYSSSPSHHSYFIMISPGNPRLIEEMPGLDGFHSPILYDHRAEYTSRFNIFTFPFNIIINQDLVISNIVTEPLTEEDIKKVIRENQ